MNIIYTLWNYTPNIIQKAISRIILFVKFKKVKIGGNCLFQIFDLIHNKIKIGKHTFIWGDSSFFANDNNIIIWKYCSIASEFYAITSNHSTEYISYHINQSKKIIDLEHEQKKADIVIGNDVWIWHRVTILPGISVWNGAIIWAWSVVTKDIPAYGIVGGNPARFIKYRFQPEKIQFLEQLQWWNWSEKKIQKNKVLFNTKVCEINTRIDY